MGREGEVQQLKNIAGIESIDYLHFLLDASRLNIVYTMRPLLLMLPSKYG
jgi:hypothetical protein